MTRMDVHDPRTWKPEDCRVWGGWTIRSMPAPYRNQVSTIVAAPSVAAALRCLHAAGARTTRGEFRDFWSETGNTLQVAVALASPGTVLYQPMGTVQASGRAGVWLPYAWLWPGVGGRTVEHR